MWRYDSGRTAASPHDLPDRLVLQWARQYAPRVQVWDDPLNNDLMQYDKVFEPIVMSGRVFVGFNDSDKVAAWDLETGEELWTYYTDGPVRFPAVGWNGRVFFTSDDGQIALVAGDGAGAVQVAAVLDASGAEARTSGGTVHVLGDAVALNAGADINVSGPAGGGGVWGGVASIFLGLLTFGVLPMILAAKSGGRRRRLLRYFEHGIPTIAEITSIEPDVRG